MDKPIELPTTAPVFRRQETGPYDYSDGPQMGSAGGGLARPPMLQRQLSGLVDQCIDIETEASDLPDIDIGFVMGTAATTGTSSTPVSSSRLVNVLMIGTGEYTTGYGGSSAQSDKAAGVVALTMLDLRRRGLVGRLGLCGVNGKKFPEIRAHMKRCIADTYSNLRDSVLGADGRVAMDTFPADDCVDAQAYREALRSFSPGDVAVIFTPDSTHFEIAMACVERGLHVFVTKPIVQTLAQHARLASLARSRGVLVAVEVHKRLDPIYVDARDKVQQQLGPFSFMHAYMSQPKYQLDTFRSWAGRDSDISYYLNSHHVDFHEWCVGAGARPVSVTALASTGVAEKLVDHKQCEDTITLSVQWEVFPEDGGDGPSSLGSASYTASWVAPRAEVHSQQRFFYMGQRGEVRVDQAHRGYGMAVDSDSVSGAGYKSLNPLFMKYTPSAAGHFSGQQGYGYRSFEAFVEAAARIVRGQNSAEDFSEASGSSVAGSVATVHDTFRTTAILEAGRRSLDSQSTISIVYDPSQKRSILPLDLLVQRQGEQKS